MLAHVIDWSLRNRFIVIVAALLIVASGAWSLARLPIDAFPDTTPVLVQINAGAPALGPVEIEQQLTLPIERSISGLPSLAEVRSVSKNGFCQVTAIFRDGTDLFRARQVVAERLDAVQLPDGVERPELGPISTGLGEVVHYILTSPAHSLSELTTLQDWVIKPQLESVPGVAEVNTWGGERRQYQVLVDPARLIKHGLDLDRVTDALRTNNLVVGGGQIVTAGELQVVRGESLITTIDDIRDIVIAAHDGVPVRVRDIAEVREGHEIRRGAVTANGRGEVVHGLVFMLMGENSHALAQRVEERIEEIRRSLPPQVELAVVYERSELVDQVIGTVRNNLLEGALLVIAVLFVFLGNLRAGLIVALAIPLSMLFAFNAMLRFGIAASLLSLGAIDFGLVVDSSVIMVENCIRRLGAAPEGASRLEVVRDAALEVRRPTMFGELIIMIVYLPILLLEGIEGKLFRPMALTVIFALSASLLFSLTLIPVLCSLGLPRRVKERVGIATRAAQAVFRPILQLALANRGPTLVLAIGAIIGGGLMAMRLGAEFVPRLSEMAISINAVRLSGVSLEESVRYSTQIERTLLEEFPDEIRDIWSRTGTADVANDPMGIEVTDIFISLKPRENWKRGRTQAELTAEIEATLRQLPGMNLAFSQPIEMRMNEMIAGVRADLGVKLFGDDLEVLKAKAIEIRDALRQVPGATDVVVEQVTGVPVLDVQIDRQAISRYGVPADHVLEMVQAMAGIPVGQVRQGQRTFGLVVRLDEQYRSDASAVGRILVPTAAGQQIPLDRVSRIRQIDAPGSINHEWGKRRVLVQCNVRGRDLAGFVRDAQERIARVELPVGYFVQYGGQYEHLISAGRRLTIVVPIALGLIFVLLYLSTGYFRDALIVFSGVPMAALGGVIALWLRDMPFTISAGVGFVAVSGVSVLNGLVLVATIKDRLRAGVPVMQAIEQTRLMRLRPILMTALVAALGFVPMALNTGVGAEVQRPLATVVIGGVISDNLLTLVVLPVLFSLFGSWRHDLPNAHPPAEATPRELATTGSA